MKNQFMTLTLAVFALTANTALAKKEAAKTSKTDKAAATTYKIDAAASSIEWTGTKATGASHTGTIALKDGPLDVAGNEIKGGQFSVKMDTLTDKDLTDAAYKAKLETHLKSEDFFNVAKYPESTFKIKSVTKKSDTEVSIKGDLTMIGKTQEVEFPATIKMDGNTITGTADVTLDRTKWDLKYGSGKFFQGLGDKMIKDDFNLKLNLVAKK